jgi:predicted enzyme related to lactoylglutathione lyase
MSVMVNIDVPDLDTALAFYTRAFGLTLRRYLGDEVAELAGWPAPVFLLQKEGGSIGAGDCRRTYERHWTPVHLDIVVRDIDEAAARAVRAGAVVEQDVRTTVWGKIAAMADPFGHGFCLIEFLNRGYDEIAVPAPTSV